MQYYSIMFNKLLYFISGSISSDVKENLWTVKCILHQTSGIASLRICGTIFIYSYSELLIPFEIYSNVWRP